MNECISASLQPAAARPSDRTFWQRHIPTTARACQGTPY